jgi:hypothetical protein
VFVHLVDANGTLVAQQDGAPENGNAPTSWWMPGDLISDRHEISLPRDMRPGHYTCAIGLYDSTNSIRLPMTDEAGNRITDDAFLLALEIIPN